MQSVEREVLRARLPLYTYFCDFYGLLVEIKQGLAGLPAGRAVPPELTPPAVQSRLLELLREQYSTVQRDCTPDQRDVYRDAQYAMAALADEQLLLEVKWDGSGDWLNLMLESALFDTRNAGVRFYRLIDSLLAVSLPTQAHAELGLVLLGALEVGFRGALRGTHEAPALASRRDELVKFVTDVRGGQTQAYAFEQAYEHTIGPKVPEPASSRLAPLSPWFNAARLATIAYLLVSGAIWFIVMQPFEHLVAHDPAAQVVREQQQIGKAAAADGASGTDPFAASGAIGAVPASADEQVTGVIAGAPAGTSAGTSTGTSAGKSAGANAGVTPPVNTFAAPGVTPASPKTSPQGGVQ